MNTASSASGSEIPQTGLRLWMAGTPGCRAAVHRRAGIRSAANLAAGAAGTITRLQCGRGGIGRRDGLDRNLSALPGNRRCRTAQIRGNLSNGNPEPSPADGREGVETRRAAPKAFGQGEGIVQTTNPALPGAAKAAAGTKIRLPQGSGGSIPPARTTNFVARFTNAIVGTFSDPCPNANPSGFSRLRMSRISARISTTFFADLHISA